MDVYRLEDSKETIGLSDYFDKGGVTIIEWSDMIENELPSERLELHFKVIDEETRVIKFVPYGKEYEDLCNYVL